MIDLMLVIACILMYAYVILRERLPIVVYLEEGGSVVTAVGKTGLYELRASSKVVIPSYNWRIVPTNVTIAPFGDFLYRGHRIALFGNVGCRVYSTPETKMKGAEVMPAVFNALPRKPIEVIVTNLNPKFPYVAREGDIVAYLELFRVPNYHLFHVVKEVDDGTTD